MQSTEFDAIAAQGFNRIPLAHFTEVVTNGAVVETNHDNPLDFIDDYFKRLKVAIPTGLPCFCSGFARYFGIVQYTLHRVASCNPLVCTCDGGIWLRWP